MNSSFTTWARLLGVTAMLLPAALKADVAIYESTTGLLSNFYGSNAVPFVPDGTPNRPTGSWIGNTITFDPTLYGEGNNFLTSVDLATYQAEGDTQTFTVELFSGSGFPILERFLAVRRRASVIRSQKRHSCSTCMFPRQ